MTRACQLQFAKLHLSQNYFQGVLLKVLRNIHSRQPTAISKECEMGKHLTKRGR